MQMASVVLHSILAPFVTDIQGLRGGDTHLCILDYLISCPMQQFKLYSPSEPRVLSLCRAALSPPTAAHAQPRSFQAWSFKPQHKAVPGGAGTGAHGCFAACSLLICCLMASSECCEALLPFCCELLKQEAPSMQSKPFDSRNFGNSMPQQWARQSQAVLSPQLLHFFTGGVMDSVNLHFSSLQHNEAQHLIECACSSPVPVVFSVELFCAQCCFPPPHSAH